MSPVTAALPDDIIWSDGAESRAPAFPDDVVWPEAPKASLADYPIEFTKGVASGVKSFPAGALKGTGAILETAPGKFNRDTLATLDRIDRGETVPETGDPVGYQHMTSEERAKVRADIERAVAAPERPVIENPVYRAGAAVEDFGQSVLAPKPGFEPGQSWTRDIGQGFGSVAGAIAANLALGPVGSGAMFLASGAGEAADKAIKAGATNEQIRQAASLGTIPGATDALDALLPALGTTGKALGFVKRAGLAAVGGALTEGGQEGVQQLLQNAIAKGIYKPDQDMMEDVARSAAIGAIVGAATSGGVSAAQGRGEAAQQGAPAGAIPADTIFPTEAPLEGEILPPERGARATGPQAALAPPPGAEQQQALPPPAQPYGGVSTAGDGFVMRGEDQPVRALPSPQSLAPEGFIPGEGFLTRDPGAAAAQPGEELPAGQQFRPTEPVTAEPTAPPPHGTLQRAVLRGQQAMAAIAPEAAPLPAATPLALPNEQAAADTAPVREAAQAPAAGAQEPISIATETPPTTGDGTRAAPVKIETPTDVNAGAERTAEPTPAQAEAGNYAKRHVQWQGLDISIETEAGALRTGMGADGKTWSAMSPVPYGYIRGTEGKDGDHLDVYLGPDPQSPRVFIVDQVDPEKRTFDEHKVLVGFIDEARARAAYEAAFSDGLAAQRVGAITAMSVAQFRRWVKNGNHKKALAYKPAGTFGSQELINSGKRDAGVTDAGFTPSQMRRLLDEEQESIINMWHAAKEPLSANASDHYRSIIAGWKRELDRLGLWQARTEEEVRDILFERRGERVRATKPERIENAPQPTAPPITRDVAPAPTPSELGIPDFLRRPKGETAESSVNYGEKSYTIAGDLDALGRPVEHRYREEYEKQLDDANARVRRLERRIATITETGRDPQSRDDRIGPEIQQEYLERDLRAAKDGVRVLEQLIEKTLPRPSNQISDTPPSAEQSAESSIRREADRRWREWVPSREFPNRPRLATFVRIVRQERRVAEREAKKALAAEAKKQAAAERRRAAAEQAKETAARVDEARATIRDLVQSAKDKGLGDEWSTFSVLAADIQDGAGAAPAGERPAGPQPAAAPGSAPGRGQSREGERDQGGAAAGAQGDGATERTENAGGTTAAEDLAEPSVALASALLGRLLTRKPLTAKVLQDEATKAFGGTLAEGKFDRRDAADALELAVNMWVRQDPGLRVDGVAGKNVAPALQVLVNHLPTQRVRSEEQVQFQQFSTPPHYSAAVVYAANLRPGDVVLEPSAGTGSLVAAASRPGVTLIANELSERRAAMLRALVGGDGRVFTENAEQIANVLPEDVKPSVVVMNPPFSQTAGRMGDKRVIETAAVHIEQAMRVLQPGGRLVAIVGRGMTMGAPAFRAWWLKISKENAVRANIGVDGSVYGKYGTNFGTRVLVIDKVPPDGAKPVLTDVQTVEDLMRVLEPIRDSRPAAERELASEPGRAGMAAGGEGRRAAASPAPAEPGGVGAGEHREPAESRRSPRAGAAGGRAVRVEAAERNVVVSEQSERPGRPDRTARQSGNDAANGAQPGAGRAEAPRNDLQPPAGGQPGPTAGSERIVVEHAAPGTQAASEITDSLYDSYTPERVRVKGAKPHPGPLVQSAAMASVPPPAPSYHPHLPNKVINDGLLSLAQLEAVIYAGQAHQGMLPAAEDHPARRRGYFIGDGTGVGKGRELAGIILDNFGQGRTKAVWVSEKRTLLQDARRDWSGLGQDANLVFDIGKVKAGEPLPAGRGVGFITYDTLKGGISDQAALARGQFVRKQKVSVNGQPGTVQRIEQQGRNKPANIVVNLENGTQITAPANEVAALEAGAVKSRVDQIVEWLGADFDGVIAFDEAHNMGNAMVMKGERGITEVAQKALAGIHLQERLPNARVVYVSATGATEVSNLAYADRLGLWGRGTPFASREKFVADVEKGGIAAMELIARDMKQLGLYTARNLSYQGVEYERLEHKLDPNQREIYDTLAEAWQIVLRNINAALEETGGNKDARAKAAAWSAFWGAHQRFFNQIVTSLQMPSVIKAVQKDLAEGRQAVLQLTNTNEASQERAAAKAQTAEEIEDLDITPRDQIIQLIEKAFPTQQYERYVDEDGKERSRPVTDRNGNPVQSRRAVAMREALIEHLSSIRVPQGPLDMVLDHFGTDVVAEVTGRGRRFVMKTDERTGERKRMEESRPGSSNIAETDAFQAGKKKVLVFSEAGGTGRSYHADNGVQSKNARRVHYLIQGGWRADKAVQGFGRTHRTNQASAPIFRLVTTDLQGQRRFISSIARRLGQLGALTKGQRQAGDQGIFSARDNLESTEASMALRQFYVDLLAGSVDGVRIDEFEEQTGLRLRSQDKEGRVTKTLDDPPPITQFLNRLLSLKIEMQNRVFDAFSQRLDAVIEARQQAGVLDVGLETIRADKIAKESERVVHTEKESGAETKYVKLGLSNRFVPIEWADVVRSKTREVRFWVKSPRGRVYAATDAPSYTDAESGRIVPNYRIISPVHGQRVEPSTTIFGSDTKWQRIDQGEAQKLWQSELDGAPEFITRDMHLITGVILPIWDRLGGSARVVRVQTDAGERLIGRVVPSGAIASTLKALGAETETAKIAPDALFDRLMAGERAKLANGWSLKRSLVAGERRIELIGPAAFSEGQEVKADGVFTERIDYKTRYFVPTEPAMGRKVIAALTKYRPATEIGGAADESQSVGFNLTPRATAQRYAIRDAIRSAIAQVAGMDAAQRARLVDRIEAEITEAWSEPAKGARWIIRGQYEYGKDLITIALADNADAIKTAYHEGWHSIEGVLTDNELRLLAHQADKLRDFVASRGEYTRQRLDDVANQEVWAEAAAIYTRERQKSRAVTGMHIMVRRVFDKVRALIERVRSAMNGLGFKAAEDVFADFAKGKMAERKATKERDAEVLPGLAQSVGPDSTAAQRRDAMQGFIARGQPLDRAMRVPFDLFGGTTEDGKWKPGLALFDKASKAIVGAKFSPEGRFAFLNPVLETARTGLIDRYSLRNLPDYIERERAVSLDERRVMLKGAEVLKSLKDHAIGPQEARVLQAVLTGEAVGDADMRALAEPIRAAVDQLGQEAVALGMVSPESYERNRATYLHRVYQKYEADQNGLSRMVNAIMGSRRKKIIGNQLKGRGIFEEIEVERLMRDVPGWNSADDRMPQPGQKFVRLDKIVEGEGEDARPRTTQRVYWPAGRAIPDNYAGFEDRGIWEVRGVKKGKLVIWRDFTKAERERMGEILDARYTIGKTFMLMAHDLAIGKFYQDIAANGEWAHAEQPNERWVDAAEWQRQRRRYTGAGDIEWVRVPDTEIANSGGKKRWGALAGKWVREEIWRDLNEIDILSHPHIWRSLLTQWKLNKTARSPVVHMNNIMSNFVLMDMSDVRWQDLVAGVRSFVKKDRDYQEALEQGVFGADMMSQEVRDQVLRPILEELSRTNTFQQGGRLGALGQMTKFAELLWSKLKTADKKMIDAYRIEDELFRIATYIRQRQLGDDPKQAADVAREQFIDYDIRAPWVNAARNTVLPFISYTYRAVPLIAKTIAARPWKVAKYAMLAYLANALAYALTGDDEDKERRSLREKEQGRSWIGGYQMTRMPFNDKFGNPIFLDTRRWVPAGDVFDLAEGDMPPWLNFGGPLMIGAELSLNRSAFTGREIFNSKTDDWWDRQAKRGDHLYKSWMPSAAWVPGSWYWEKIENAVKGATDRQGRPYDVGLAVSSSFGVKLKPHDVQDAMAMKGAEFARIERELQTEARRLAERKGRNMISQSEFNKGMAAITKKLERLGEKARETFK